MKKFLVARRYTCEGSTSCQTCIVNAKDSDDAVIVAMKKFIEDYPVKDENGHLWHYYHRVNVISEIISEGVQ